MSAINTKGIILRKYFLRETSYILVVFTREFGKIRGVLKGARKPYPQFAGNFELFAECNILFYRKKKRALDLVTLCEAVDFFLEIRKDIERVGYAEYFIELIDTVTGDHDVNERLYDVLSEGLRLLAAGVSPRRAGRIFELKLLGALGLDPRLDVCVKCSRPPQEGLCFSVKNGGIMCRACSSKDDMSLSISRGALNFMRKIYSLTFEGTTRIKVSGEVGKEIERVLKDFIRYHIGTETKSMRFLEEIEKRGAIGKATGPAQGSNQMSEDGVALEPGSLRRSNLAKNPVHYSQRTDDQNGGKG